MPDVDGAIVRVRYTATEEDARQIDHAGVRAELEHAGAWRVSFEPTILRETQARVEIAESTDDLEAFDQWLEAEQLDAEQPSRHSKRDTVAMSNRLDHSGGNHGRLGRLGAVGVPASSRPNYLNAGGTFNPRAYKA